MVRGCPIITYLLYTPIVHNRQRLRIYEVVPVDQYVLCMIFTQMYAHDGGPWYLREIGDQSSRMIQCIRQTSVHCVLLQYNSA
jgi:hypothetical protein